MLEWELKENNELSFLCLIDIITICCNVHCYAWTCIFHNIFIIKDLNSFSRKIAFTNFLGKRLNVGETAWNKKKILRIFSLSKNHFSWCLKFISHHILKTVKIPLNFSIQKCIENFTMRWSLSKSKIKLGSFPFLSSPNEICCNTHI